MVGIAHQETDGTRDAFTRERRTNGPVPASRTEFEMTIQRPERGILDRIADAIARLLGREVAPAPVPVPVRVRRPNPVQIPIERRLR